MNFLNTLKRRQPKGYIFLQLLAAASLASLLFSSTSSANTIVDQEKKLPPVTVIYVSEIICDPKNDYFEFSPKAFSGDDIEAHIKQNPALARQRKFTLEANIQNDPKLAALRGKEYGIFFNGELVSETEFHHSCELKDVTINIDIDYTKARTRSEVKYWCEKDIPEFYREYAESIREKAVKPLCIRQTNGGMTVLHQGKRIGYWDYFKYKNRHTKISYKSKKMDSCDDISMKCSSASLDELIKTPVFWKPFLRQPSH